MRKIISIISITILYIASASAQQNSYRENKVWKDIHEVLSEFNYPKDSLLIYSLNFTLKIGKKGGKLVPIKIVANDSLAYQLFPNYKNLIDVDFSSILGGNSKLDVMIPILIFGSSPEKMLYKDLDGRPLINFNAAVNSALALTSNKKYDNLNSTHDVARFQTVTKPLKSFRSLVMMDPYIIHILNIR